MKHYAVKINREEALRYLGYGGQQPDAMVSKQLDEMTELLENISAPAYTYKICGLKRETPDTFRLQGTSITLTGTTASSFLTGCRSCIMMAVTIGSRIDGELRRRQIMDMAGAVILDSCASSAVESICEQLEEDLEKTFNRKHAFLTDRFSPGYGDLPLSLQPEICRALSAEKRIGLSVSGGMLLMPSKSVTAFIGISDRPQPKQIRGCGSCSMNQSCEYRKAGITCAE